MMPWFVWKGKNSIADFGLWIGKLPKRVKPEERNEQIEIPGRAGSLTMLEGDDIYSSYSSEMTVIARNTLQMDEIIDWLRGSSDLILSTDTEKARPARIVGEVAFERDGNNLQQAVIPFVFQPFRKQIKPETVTFTGTSKTIYNPGDVASRPVVSITGSGTVTVAINGQQMSFTLGSSAVTINVDCDAQIITSNNEIWAGSFLGDFWKMPKGQVIIENSGGSSISISPNWRWL